MLHSLKGDAYKHIPRTSTIASSATWIPSVRSLDCSDEALSKRLSTKCSDSHLSHPLHTISSGIATLGSAWTVNHTVGDNGHVRLYPRDS